VRAPCEILYLSSVGEFTNKTNALIQFLCIEQYAIYGVYASTIRGVLFYNPLMNKPDVFSNLGWTNAHLVRHVMLIGVVSPAHRSSIEPMGAFALMDIVESSICLEV